MEGLYDANQITSVASFSNEEFPGIPVRLPDKIPVVFVESSAIVNLPVVDGLELAAPPNSWNAHVYPGKYTAVVEMDKTR